MMKREIRQVHQEMLTSPGHDWHPTVVVGCGVFVASQVKSNPADWRGRPDKGCSQLATMRLRWGSRPVMLERRAL